MNQRHYGDLEAGTVLIQMVDDQDLQGMAREVEQIIALSRRDFHLIALPVQNWNRDLSPWPAPPVFGRQPFGDGARRTLEAALELTGDPEKTYVLGGYSLAGLFSLWAAHETDAFAAVAACSPSVWFPDFVDYVRANDTRAGGVYLSLGDRESRTRNRTMATVADNLQRIHDLIAKRGVACTLQWNPGNHFADPDLRMAAGFAWAMGFTSGRTPAPVSETAVE